jgi:uncharacterized protein YndB with AHSA1/START domain
MQPIDPLRFEFTVACPPERAFELWANETSRWWPADHTVSATTGLTVTIEPRQGGRIYERTTDGTEHDWGRVVAWEPPRRLAYTWHLAQDPADATEVEIVFEPVDVGGTRVVITHSGWERLGARGAELRGRNQMGWSTLLPHYERAAEPFSTH